MRANVSLSHRKLTGFEEISTSRWSQYILKLPGSISEESYGLEKSKFSESKFSIAVNPAAHFRESGHLPLYDVELTNRAAGWCGSAPAATPIAPPITSGAMAPAAPLQRTLLSNHSSASC